MSLHLIDRATLIAGYESGHVVLYSYEGTLEGVTDGRLPDVGGSSLKTGRGKWVQKWKVKGHTEAGESALPFKNPRRRSKLTSTHLQ